MGKMHYEISARAAILLGRENVSKVDGAVIELVKNTYDADATCCLICFDIARDSIYILDNGEGMTEDVIRDCWMVIGTDNKKLDFLSKGERVKAGEKGIGRFALDRLGEKCEMFTKSSSNDKVIRWYNDWSKFEELGKKLQDIEADIEYIESDFIDCIPSSIAIGMEFCCKKNNIDIPDFKSGTYLKITGLRDKWDEYEITKIIDKLEFIAPPYSNLDHKIFIKKNFNDPFVLVENQTTDEFDYKIDALFDGERFAINLYRNEYDINIIPQDVFEMPEFQKVNYSYEDFKKGKISFELSIPEVMKSEDQELISNVQKLGAFEFKYIFMKRAMQADSKKTFFYKEISNNRSFWLDQHGGIKIYRDNFLVRPYGDPKSEAFDWLGLDTRQAGNPAAISDANKPWYVNNKQGQGTLLISRIYNECILDKSSREGLIENEYFTTLKNVLVGIISIFENDRKNVAVGFKKYHANKPENKSDKTRENGKKIATAVIRRTDNNTGGNASPTQPIIQQEDITTLAKTVKLFEEEVEDLMSEIKILRSLATNGLITTTLGHDLNNLDANLVTRVKSLKDSMRLNDADLVAKHLRAIKNEDEFMKSWVSVITSQLKMDKRKRFKHDVYLVISDLVKRMKPILDHKKVDVILEGKENVVFKKCFASDIESIMFNLIINSIEAFSSYEVEERKIKITVLEKGNLIIRYEDNGPGINPMFVYPEEIFNFGTTSKKDKNGVTIGTGLGMYIVASTVREYDGECMLNTVHSGFSLDLIF